MIRAIVKLAIAVALANALFQVAQAYVSYYRFSDAVHEEALHAGKATVDQIRDKVLELASTYEEPIDPESVAIRQDEHHTYIDGDYKKPIPIFPGLIVQWPFSLKVDGYLVVPPKLVDLPDPQ